MKQFVTSLAAFIVLFIHVAPAQFSEQYAGSITSVYYSSLEWGDYDNDGDLDLLVTGNPILNSSNYFTRIYENTGSGFSSVTTSIPGVYEGSASWGDYDNDGDLDVLITGNSSLSTITSIYRNSGGSFSEVSGTPFPGAYGHAGWVDYDNDGDLDVFVSGFSLSIGVHSKLFQNSGGSFSEVYAGTFEGMYDGSFAWGDYDNDGDKDLILTGTAAVTMERTTRLYQNTGSGFTSVSHPFPGVFNSFCAFGDYDNDGDLDLFLMGNTPSGGVTKVYSNSGGSFTTAATLPPIELGSGAWGDYDNDGDLDLITTAYSGYGGTKLYQNTGSGFSEVFSGTFPALDIGASAWGDYDNDGDLDIVVSGDSSNTLKTKIYRNTGSTFNSVATAPSGLSAVAVNGNVTFTWNKSTDSQTAQNGLNYNLVIGTSANGVNKLSPMANRTTGFRRIAKLGNSQTNSLTIKNLPLDQTYHWSVQAVDAAFAGSAFATESSITPVSEPAQASSVQFSSLDYFSMTVGWTNGGGTKRLVLMKQGSPVDAAPTDTSVYTANAAFGSGQQIGSGNYVVYDGTGSSVNVSGLQENTTYYIAVFEYNGTTNTQNYNSTSPATGSQSTVPLPAARYALSFDGVNDYVSLPQISAASAFTIEAWVKLSSSPSGQILIAGSSQGHPQLVARPGLGNPSGLNTVRIQFKDNNANFPGVNSTTALSTGVWYHVAGVWDGSTVKIYVNGVMENSAAVAVPAANTDIFSIGGFNGSQYFPGTIDEVRLWTAARTTSEIQSSYHSVAVNSSGLLGYWKFNESSGATTNDSTSSGLNGTLTNGPTRLVSTAPFGTPAYSANVSSLSFGTVNSGSTKQDSVTITNTGLSILNITNASSINAYYTVSPSAAGIISGGSKKFYVTFAPLVNGLQSGDATFTTNANGSPHSVSLSGTGYVPPQFSSSSNSISFPTIALGVPSMDSVVVTNNGGSDLIISSATVATDEYSVFVPSSTIAAGESKPVFVIFNPGLTGVLPDTVTIVHNAAGSPKKIGLSGSGIIQSVSEPMGAVTFSGNGAAATSLSNLSGSELTIEYWFKGTNVQSAVRQQNGGDYIVAGWSSSPIHIMSNDGGTGSGLSMGNVNDNQWHHVAMTWKQNTVNGFKSYLDGTIIAQRTSGNTPIPNMSIGTYIGSYIGGGEFTTGEMDEVRIWNVERSTDSIRHYMNRPLAGNETGLAGYWRMNEYLGSRIVDATGHGYHGTVSNNEWDDSEIRMPGAAMVFSSRTLAYGSIMVGATKADSITITNSGTDPLPISSLVSSPAELTISVADADSVIAPGGSSKVFLTFTPVSAGTKNGTLTITSTEHPDVTVAWTALATAAEPTAQGTGFTYGEGIKSMTIHFNAGNGDGRIILMKSGSAVSSDPADFTAYTVNANFGSGSQIGSGNYVVYSGTGDSVVVTNLTPGTTYYVAMYEYNGAGSGINYLLTSPVTGSHAARTPDFQKIGTALSFNGNTDGTGTYVSVSGSSISFSSITIEAWVKWNGTSGFKVIVGRPRINGEASLTSGVILALNNGTPYGHVAVSPWNYENRASSTGTSLTPNVWTHVAYVYQGLTGILYINGGNAGSSGYGTNLGVTNSSAQTMLIGKEFVSSSNDRCFPGDIDEVRIWTTARSQGQIQSGMYTPLAGNESGLAAYYQFNESSGTTANDSINARHGTIVNSYSRTNSSVPFGPLTTLTSVQTGEQMLSNITLNMADGFDSPVNLTLREHFGTSSVIPSSATRMIGGKYYSISASGTPGNFRTGMKFILGAGEVDVRAEDYPEGVQLYKRSSATDNDTWQYVASADSVDVPTGTVYFPDSVTSFSQFIIVEEDNALPVEIASFTASSNRLNTELKWSTASEVNNFGFEIERSGISNQSSVSNGHSDPDLSGEESSVWTKIDFVEGNGTTSAPKEYSFTDKNLTAGKYSYRLKQIDRDGKFKYSQEVEVEIGNVPKVFALEQNYPNPFNPATTIGFTLQVSGFTSLKIYDAIGREVAALVNENLEAGVYHQKTFDASKFSSGIYFARLQNGGQQVMKKMLLMK